MATAIVSSMLNLLPRSILATGLVLVTFLRPRADPPAANLLPSELCSSAIEWAENGAGIPNHLLAAIGRAESGRLDPRSGQWRPWPWTIDVDGQGYFYGTKAAAVRAVLELQARGVKSVDVGCMQVNLQWHPAAFTTLEEAFDPRTNCWYASQFLVQLFRLTRSWTRAVGYYHSATPGFASPYVRRVLAIGPQGGVIGGERKSAGPQNELLQQLTAAWAVTLDKRTGEASDSK